MAGWYAIYWWTMADWQDVLIYQQLGDILRTIILIISDELVFSQCMGLSAILFKRTGIMWEHLNNKFHCVLLLGKCTDHSISYNTKIKIMTSTNLHNVQTDT